MKATRQRSRKAQSTLEYAVAISVIIAALLVMQIYMKRGVAGKLRVATDQIGDQFNPYTATRNLTHTRNGTTDETGFANGASTTGFNAVSQGTGGDEQTVGTNMAAETLFAP